MTSGKFELPDRPSALSEAPVAAWAEPLVIDTYPVPPPDRNPMFLEHRVYQGSSGRVYPNPVTDHVADVAAPTAWDAVHLENEYLRVVILPALGGRIHVVQDRKTGYDIFYRQNVIKPGLVGLLGPWISGGVEFNWPQHHRPSTFMPTDWEIEQEPDGGAVVWCSEHEPTQRMKGMHGIALKPRSALLEVRGRLTNRTPLVQSFLWWANVCVRVSDDYEAYFPPDVTHVADHAKRAVSTFPIARGRYYGVDYGSRPAAKADLRWYRNIPVPTSYMAMGSSKDFFGGYDHGAGEGYVHWADHTISPGKKLWTWGDHGFGHAWDRELTDDDGPYVELMAGVFTDNQPDFSFLLPGEVRTFSQYWYPLVGIGPAHEANREAAVHLERTAGGVRLGVATTRPHPEVAVRLTENGSQRVERIIDIAPEQPFVCFVSLHSGARVTDLELSVQAEGTELIAYQPTRQRAGTPPPPAAEPPPPETIGSLEELYLTGIHLVQYRHATRRPEAYFGEALRRDAGDSRCNTAMGEWHLRRGELASAERHLRVALERLSIRNTNPRDGEAGYLLGVTLQLQGRPAEADDVLGKAGWDGAFGAASAVARAEIANRRGDVEAALASLDQALVFGTTEPRALGLKAALLRRRGSTEAAREVVERALKADAIDVRALHELSLLDGDRETRLPGGTQTALDIAHDEARAGLLLEAIDVLLRAEGAPIDRGSEALLHFTLAWLADRLGDAKRSRHHLRLARQAPPDYAFPMRLEEITVLEWAIGQAPDDPRASYYLGNLLYDKRRYEEAIRRWRRAARLEPGFPTVHRNLGIAEFNVLKRPDRALAAYRKAQRADPSDARVLYELDQLRKRLAHRPEERLRELERLSGIVLRRDDLAIEYVTLLNRVGRHSEALQVLQTRRFHPWEGGEGLVSGQWVIGNRELSRRALGQGDVSAALHFVRAAMTYPPGLGEGKHLLTPENELQLLLADCLGASGDAAAADEWLERAASPQGDPDAPRAEGLYWQALALRALGRDELARSRLADLAAAAEAARTATTTAPYFATSLPTMLLFDDDLSRRAEQDATYLEGLAKMGQGQTRAAAGRFARLTRARPDHLEAVVRLEELRSAKSAGRRGAARPQRAPTS